MVFVAGQNKTRKMKISQEDDTKHRALHSGIETTKVYVTDLALE